MPSNLAHLKFVLDGYLALYRTIHESKMVKKLCAGYNRQVLKDRLE